MCAVEQSRGSHPTDERRLPTSPSAEALRELTAFRDEITTLLLEPRVGWALSIKKSGFLTCGVKNGFNVFKIGKVQRVRRQKRQRRDKCVCVHEILSQQVPDLWGDVLCNRKTCASCLH